MIALSSFLIVFIMGPLPVIAVIAFAIKDATRRKDR